MDFTVFKVADILGSGGKQIGSPAVFTITGNTLGVKGLERKKAKNEKQADALQHIVEGRDTELKSGF